MAMAAMAMLASAAAAMAMAAMAMLASAAMAMAMAAVAMAAVATDWQPGESARHRP